MNNGGTSIIEETIDLGGIGEVLGVQELSYSQGIKIVLTYR